MASTSKILPQIADPVSQIAIAFLNVLHGDSLLVSGVRIRAVTLLQRRNSIGFYGDDLLRRPAKPWIRIPVGVPLAGQRTIAVSEK